MNTSTTINNNPVGFFDSGVGGLTVYSKFRNKLPNENCLYFGDTKHLPYGNKTKEELSEFKETIEKSIGEQIGVERYNEIKNNTKDKISEIKDKLTEGYNKTKEKIKKWYNDNTN